MPLWDWKDLDADDPHLGGTVYFLDIPSGGVGFILAIGKYGVAYPARSATTLAALAAS